MANVMGWSILDGMRFSGTVGRHLKDRSKYSTEEFIEAAELAAAEHPDAWVVFYTLADKYQDVGRLRDSLEACRRCTELRPNDIRSAYAMASNYYVLTSAEWAGRPEGARRATAERFQSLGLAFDPEGCRQVLDDLGLSVEDAAAEAVRWFQVALTLRPDRASRTDIEESLAALQEKYPRAFRVRSSG